MTKTAMIYMLAVLAALAVAGDRAAAQTSASDTRALRADIERRFEVDRLRNGVALRPRDSSRGIRLIEVTDGPVAVDGQPATGAELREKLGADDAELVLRLSYLADAQRRDLFGLDAGGPTAPTAAPPPPPEPPRAPRRPSPRFRGRSDQDRVSVFSGGITVREDEVVEGDVVAIGGPIRIDGDVRGDVVAVGGSVTLGPRASVDDNVVVVAGALHRDPGARIGGRVQEVRVGSMDFSNMRGFNPLRLWWGSMMGSAVAFVGTVARFGILCLLTALVVLFGRPYVERASEQAWNEPLKAGAIGVLAQILFLPVLIITCVVLVVTIIGIPLLFLIPFIILGLALVGLVGFTGVAYRLGGVLSSRFGWATDNPYTTTIIGIALVLSPLLLARLINLGGFVMVPFSFGLGLIGALIEYLAWTIGFGSVALARFNRRASSNIVPPPEIVTPATT